MKINKKILSWLAVSLWLVVIYKFSNQPALSSEGSSEILVKVLLRVLSLFKINVSNIMLVHFFVRKLAHLFLYMVTSILILNAFKMTNIGVDKASIITLAICILYASIDEIHQSFIPGRSGEFRDVLIDTFGALLGIGIYRNIDIIKNLFFRFIRHLKKT